MTDHNEENMLDQIFISTYVDQLDMLVDGVPPKVAFDAYKQLLETMRADPMESLVTQKLCESMLEVRILTILVQELQASIAVSNINLN